MSAQDQVNGSITCMLVGNNTVGKTCFLVSYLHDQFPVEYLPATVDTTSITVNVDNDTFQLLLWDTRHSEENRYRTLVYPHIDVFLICVDISNKYSFNNVKDKWFPEINLVVPDAAVLILGCKQDLRIDFDKLLRGYIRSIEYQYRNGIPIEILDIIKIYYYANNKDETVNELMTENDGWCLCKEIGAYKYMECSALNMTGTHAVIDEICRCYIANRSKKVNCGCLVL